MKSKTDLQQLSSNLQQVFSGRDWHLLWQTYKLVEHWPEVVGKTVAAKSSPAYIRKKILWIYVNDSVWMQHLHTQKNLLLQNVRAYNGGLNIEDIRWLLQPVGKLQDRGEKDTRRTREINPAERKEFEKIASSVKNEECRDALCRLWRTYHEKK